MEQKIAKVTACIYYVDELEYEELLHRYMEGKTCADFVIAVNRKDELIGIAQVSNIVRNARTTNEMISFLIDSKIELLDDKNEVLAGHLIGDIFEIDLYIPYLAASDHNIKQTYVEIYDMLKREKINVVRVAVPENPRRKQWCFYMAGRGFYGIYGKTVIEKVCEYSYDEAYRRFEEQKGTEWIPDAANEQSDGRIFLVGPCIANQGMNLYEDALPIRLQQRLKQMGYAVNIVCINMYRANLDNIYSLFEHKLTNRDMVFLVEEERFLPSAEINVETEFKNYSGNKWLYYEVPIHATIYGEQIIIDRMIKDSFVPWIENVRNDKEQVLFDGTDILKKRKQLKIKEEVNKYIQTVQSLCTHMKPGCGAIVMNANPFTNGHRYLVECALKQVEQLIIFVVEEDRSNVPFDDRIELVRQGVMDLSNVVVVPSGNFIISSTTFQSYFEKETKTEAVIDAAMDIEIFGKYIAPVFGIAKRFVGEEPTDFITRQYNEQMAEQLPRYGVQLIEISRKQKENSSEAISASTVRGCLQMEDYSAIEKLVPSSTLTYLKNNFEKLERRKKCAELIEAARRAKEINLAPISNLKEVLEEIRKNEMTVIYGTEIDALMVLKNLPTECLTQIRFCDQKARSTDYQFMNMPVYPPESITKQEKVVVASREYRAEIVDFLRDREISLDHMIFLRSNW